MREKRTANDFLSLTLAICTGYWINYYTGTRSTRRSISNHSLRERLPLTMYRFFRYIYSGNIKMSLTTIVKPLLPNILEAFFLLIKMHLMLDLYTWPHDHSPPHVCILMRNIILEPWRIATHLTLMWHLLDILIYQIYYIFFLFGSKSAHVETSRYRPYTSRLTGQPF